MNSTIIALMLVTSQGATELATFDSEEECLKAKAQITSSDSFCYKRGPFDPQDSLDQMSNILKQMAKSMKEAMKEMKEDE
jgi:hypothetical protein